MTDRSRSLNTRWSMLDELQDRGAEDTWRWFIDRYRSYIRTCLHRLIRPGEQAEQAVDEFWSYLFASSVIANADRNRRFRTYLAGTVRHFAFAWLRAHASDATEAAVEAASSEPDPSRRYEEQDMLLWTRQVVQLALAELAKGSADQAQALRWFYGLPASIDDDGGEPRPASWIAAQLGLKTNAAHQLVFRARNRLRACIENELRETVLAREDLDDERRLVYAVIAQENPGLEPEADERR
ncbi:MAG: sigma-70 family RNA polymerase sigma factor [Planctomycetes bacterium]|nr:sigma-70 family RNA polymerase sigma factor [Planctomycetota bacterium]